MYVIKLSCQIKVFSLEWNVSWEFYLEQTFTNCGYFEQNTVLASSILSP